MSSRRLRRRLPGGFSTSPTPSHRRATSMYATPITSTAIPTGVKLKKLNPWKPCSLTAPSTTMFGAVPTNVSMPLIKPAQRHHQPPGKHAQPLGHIESYRDEDRDYPGGTHDRAETGYRQHQQHQQPGFAVAGHP